MARVRLGITGVVALTLLAGCTGGDGPAGPQGLTVPAVNAPRQLGAGEGRVSLVAWPGYVENGSTDPKADWVSSFEKSTGCAVTVKTATSSQEMLELMKTGHYDAVSAPGDITLRLITDGAVAPINTGLLKNYNDVYDALKRQPWNSVRNVQYGVAHGRGANLLMWRTDLVTPPVNSWSAVFEENSPYKGKITEFDSPISIADAALYLKSTRPELGIKDPFALDAMQFAEVTSLLRKQRASVRQYWTDYASEVRGFQSGDVVVGSTWQSIAALAKIEKAPVEAAMPKEGTTGWSDSWMIAANGRHRNCAYRWMDHIISPKVNAQVSEWFGQAPSNRKACAYTSDKTFCTTYHANDERYFSRVAFRRTPVRQCLDGRATTCKDYADWAKAWAEIKG